MRTNSILIIITAWLFAGVIGAAESPSPAQTVLLTLVDGAAKSLPTDYETHDLELELVRREGAFEPKVWGFAEDLGYGDHEGQVTANKDGRLEIELVLNQPLRAPDFRRRFGMARYAITLEEKDGAYSGTFTGTVTIEFPAPRKGQSNVREVSGNLTGKTYPCWTEPRPGFKPLAPKEHPRLIFRKHDLPMLRERMKTPEGQAIMARMKAQLAGKFGNPFYEAASWSVAYQLTGDAEMAKRAADLLAAHLDNMPPISGHSDSQVAYGGGVTVGLALALDHCYEAWDSQFRHKAIDRLAERLTLLTVQPKDPNYWRNDIRMFGIPLAAICLLGEQTSDGKPISDLERTVHCGLRFTRRHFQLNGTSNTGWPLEYRFHQMMVWNSGPGHAIQAYRSAMGGEPMAGWWGQWAMIGEWMREPPAADIAGSKTIGGKQLGGDTTSGYYPTAWMTVPDAMKPGARWLYDHCFGLEGAKTFGIHWPFQAGYVLMGYPFDATVRHPGESLPWAAPDPTGGHWIFRKPWKDANDSLVLLNPRNDLRWKRGGHYSPGPNWEMEAYALGRRWTGITGYNGHKDQPGSALPLVGGALNGTFSARLLEYQADDRGKASLAFDLSPIYFRPPAKGEQFTPGPGQRIIRGDRLALNDLGIRGRRDLAIDLTGDCGAPTLMAIADRFQNAKDLVWRLILDTNAGPAQVVGNTVTVGDPAAENMRVTFVSPKSPTLTGEITAKGGEEYFVVITVQKGKAPEMKIEGEGLSAKVTVGGQTIQRDGERLVIGNLNKPKQP